jgi:hypothetical protein
MGGGARWSSTETWGDDAFAVTGTTYSADGFSFKTDETWYSKSAWSLLPSCSEDPFDPNPCVCYGQGSFVGNVYPCPPFSQQQQVNFPLHYVGNSTTKFSCAAGPTPISGASTGPQAVTSATVPKFIALDETEVAPADRTSSNAIVVPPANGPNPGRVVLYLTRPFHSTRAQALEFQKINPGSSGPRFETWFADFWKMGTNSTFENVWSITGSGGRCSVSEQIPGQGYSAMRWLKVLLAATETVEGQVAMETFGVRNTSTSFGEAGRAVEAKSLSATINH